MAGTLVANTINTDTGLFSTNNAYSGVAKAWCNFNPSGTPTISSSFNVSSLTRNGTGDYSLNFATAMVDANYATVTNTTITTSTYVFSGVNTQTTTYTRVSMVTTSGSGSDQSKCYVAVLGN
jgi:hypothetical protein